VTELEAFCRSHTCEIPVARSGNWRIARYLGYWTALIEGDQLWMTDTPDEIAAHEAPYREAKARGGHVLINGLGLGLITRAILSLPNVESVNVFERSREVIELVYPYLPGKKLIVTWADAPTELWPNHKHWSVVWHDIWTHKGGNAQRLWETFQDHCDWQGAWGSSAYA
jgi:hypothetical protein